MHLRKQLQFLPFASVLLATCSIQSQNSDPPKTSLQWQWHQQTVAKITQYQTHGVFIYLSNRQKVYARFNLKQSSTYNYRLILTNIFGSTELQLDTQGSVVQLIDNKGKRYTSNNAEQMISQITGMDIPLFNMRQWILGLPGDATDYQLNKHYQLQSLTYSGNGQHWKVHIGNYYTKVTPPLPVNLEFTKGDQHIKLRMDSWTLQ